MDERQHAQFDPRDVLNTLRASIAVLDPRGIIVLVNEAWIRFARENGAKGERSFVGEDYLAVCERALAATRRTLPRAPSREVRRVRTSPAGRSALIRSRDPGRRLGADPAAD